MKIYYMYILKLRKYIDTIVQEKIKKFLPKIIYKGDCLLVIIYVLNGFYFSPNGMWVLLWMDSVLAAN